MGQKIHPLGLRLGITQKHRSQWIARVNITRWRWLLQDKAIREYLYKEFKEAGIGEIIILRKQQVLNQMYDPLDLIEVQIWAANANNICNTNNYERVLPKLGEKLGEVCSKKQFPGMWLFKPEFKIYPRVFQIEDAQHQANAIADELIKELEDRTPFRKALKKVINNLHEKPPVGKNKNKSKRKLSILKGVRIQLSGRLNGAEIARIEWSKYGRVPLQTLRADMDYVSKTAKTTHGILGIKVWTFKGEKR